MSGPSAIMNVMQTAARKASRDLLRDFGEVEKLQVSRKGPADFVSRADKKAEETIHEILAQARPGYGFLLEEGGEIPGTDKTHRFIIDPLDGTTNYLHGIPHFAISIALERTLEGKRELVETADGSLKVEKSLQNGCMKCHTSKVKFCDTCHEYASVKPYCWDCHLAPVEPATGKEAI